MKTRALAATVLLGALCGVAIGMAGALVTALASGMLP